MVLVVPETASHLVVESHKEIPVVAIHMQIVVPQAVLNKPIYERLDKVEKRSRKFK